MAFPIKIISMIFKILIMQKQIIPNTCMGRNYAQTGFEDIVCIHNCSSVNMNMKSKKQAKASDAIILVNSSLPTEGLLYPCLSATRSNRKMLLQNYSQFWLSNWKVRHTKLVSRYQYGEGKHVDVVVENGVSEGWLLQRLPVHLIINITQQIDY